MRIITPHDYHDDPESRRLADQIMNRLGLDPNEVAQIDLAEFGVSYVLLVRDADGKWTGERRRVQVDASY